MESTSALRTHLLESHPENYHPPAISQLLQTLTPSPLFGDGSSLPNPPTSTPASSEVSSPIVVCSPASTTPNTKRQRRVSSRHPRNRYRDSTDSDSSDTSQTEEEYFPDNLDSFDISSLTPQELAEQQANLNFWRPANY